MFTLYDGNVVLAYATSIAGAETHLTEWAQAQAEVFGNYCLYVTLPFDYVWAY